MSIFGRNRNDDDNPDEKPSSSGFSRPFSSSRLPAGNANNDDEDDDSKRPAFRRSSVFDRLSSDEDDEKPARPAGGGAPPARPGSGGSGSAPGGNPFRRGEDSSSSSSEERPRFGSGASGSSGSGSGGNNPFRRGEDSSSSSSEERPRFGSGVSGSSGSGSGGNNPFRRGEDSSSSSSEERPRFGSGVSGSSGSGSGGNNPFRRGEDSSSSSSEERPRFGSGASGSSSGGNNPFRRGEDSSSSSSEERPRFGSGASGSSGSSSGGNNPFRRGEDSSSSSSEERPRFGSGASGSSGSGSGGNNPFRRGKDSSSSSSEERPRFGSGASGSGSGGNNPFRRGEDSSSSSSEERPRFGSGASGSSGSGSGGNNPFRRGEDSSSSSSEERPRFGSGASGSSSGSSGSNPFRRGEEAAKPAEEKPPARSGLFGRGGSAPAEEKKEEEKPAASSGSRFGFGRSTPADEKKEEEKPAASGGGRFSFGRSAAPAEEKKEEKPAASGGGRFSFGRSAPAEEKKEEEKPARSGGMFGRGGSAPAEEKKEEKPARSGLFGRGGSAPAEEKKEPEKPAASGGRFGGMFGRGGSAPAEEKKEEEKPARSGGMFGRGGASTSPAKPASNRAASNAPARSGPFGGSATPSSRSSGGSRRGGSSRAASGGFGGATTAAKPAAAAPAKGKVASARGDKKPLPGEAPRRINLVNTGLSLDAKLNILGAGLGIAGLLLLSGFFSSPDSTFVFAKADAMLATYVGLGRVIVELALLIIGVWLLIAVFGNDIDVEYFRLIALGVLFLMVVGGLQWATLFFGFPEKPIELASYLQENPLTTADAIWSSYEDKQMVSYYAYPATTDLINASLATAESGRGGGLLGHYVYTNVIFQLGGDPGSAIILLIVSLFSAMFSLKLTTKDLRESARGVNHSLEVRREAQLARRETRAAEKAEQVAAALAASSAAGTETGQRAPRFGGFFGRRATTPEQDQATAAVATTTDAEPTRAEKVAAPPAEKRGWFGRRTSTPEQDQEKAASGQLEGGESPQAAPPSAAPVGRRLVGDHVEVVEAESSAGQRSVEDIPDDAIQPEAPAAAGSRFGRLGFGRTKPAEGQETPTEAIQATASTPSAEESEAKRGGFFGRLPGRKPAEATTPTSAESEATAPTPAAEEPKRAGLFGRLPGRKPAEATTPTSTESEAPPSTPAKEGEAKRGGFFGRLPGRKPAEAAANTEVASDTTVASTPAAEEGDAKRGGFFGRLPGRKPAEATTPSSTESEAMAPTPVAEEPKRAGIFGRLPGRKPAEAETVAPSMPVVSAAAPVVAAAISIVASDSPASPVNEDTQVNQATTPISVDAPATSSAESSRRPTPAEPEANVPRAFRSPTEGAERPSIGGFRRAGGEEDSSPNPFGRQRPPANEAETPAEGSSASRFGRRSVDGEMPSRPNPFARSGDSSTNIPPTDAASAPTSDDSEAKPAQPTGRFADLRRPEGETAAASENPFARLRPAPEAASETPATETNSVSEADEAKPAQPTGRFTGLRRPEGEGEAAVSENPFTRLRPAPEAASGTPTAEANPDSEEAEAKPAQPMGRFAGLRPPEGEGETAARENPFARLRPAPEPTSEASLDSEESEAKPAQPMGRFGGLRRPEGEGEAAASENPFARLRPAPEPASETPAESSPVSESDEAKPAQPMGRFGGLRRPEGEGEATASENPFARLRPVPEAPNEVPSAEASFAPDEAPAKPAQASGLFGSRRPEGEAATASENPFARSRPIPQPASETSPVETSPASEDSEAKPAQASGLFGSHRPEGEAVASENPFARLRPAPESISEATPTKTSPVAEESEAKSSDESEAIPARENPFARLRPSTLDVTTTAMPQSPAAATPSMPPIATPAAASIEAPSMPLAAPAASIPAPAATPTTPAPAPAAGDSGLLPYQSPWSLPDFTTVLEPGNEQEIDQFFILEQARLIEDTLGSFGAPGKVVEVNTGPVITQFGVEPDYLEKRGGRTRVKVSSIAQLDKDIALALAARSIRIEAPVPGKGFVGIEVPNAEPSVVSLRDVMSSEGHQQAVSQKSKLTIGLGQSVDGAPVSADLTQMPHLLIAGTTGSGKSVCVNAIISCLLLQNSPDELQLIMVDPKRVELTGYNGIPHLISSVVVDLERIIGVLKWVQREMDERYKKLGERGARNIQDYNRRLPVNIQPMPYMVVIIDELADLMMLAPDETEKLLARLAQMSRATGIHLIISTQRPSVDVVTGLIKANFPARIAFAVASGVDSRVILDTPGAEKLLGRGDMLFQSPDASSPVRMQGVYLSDPEIDRLTRYWKEQAVLLKRGGATPNNFPKPHDPTEAQSMQMPSARSERFNPDSGKAAPPANQRSFLAEVDALAKQATRGGAGDDEAIDDAMYEEAVKVVQNLNKASVSLLQRRLRIGYTRAARLIDLMEERGVIGPAESGSKPRNVVGGPEVTEDDED